MTFENLPQAVTRLICKVDELNVALQQLITNGTQPTGQWFNVDELRAYLPDHPARQTIYCWIGQRAIPYHKKGKKLQFLKTEIDAWLLEEKHQTVGELQAQADDFMERRRTRQIAAKYGKS